MKIVSCIDDCLLDIEMGVIMGRPLLLDTFTDHASEEALVIASKIKEREPSEVEQEFAMAVKRLFFGDFCQ
jgi:hypothetical protein